MAIPAKPAIIILLKVFSTLSKKVLIPIPHQHFDPTEVAIPWKILTNQNIEVIFATPDGKKASCDQLMITGKRLGILSSVLMADSNARTAYAEMEHSTAFNQPLNWNDLEEKNFDGLILPGGHDKGMREYLESAKLQREVVKYFEQEKPVGAICHGVVLAARSKRADGRSVLFGKKTTSLLATQEYLAWMLTCLWLKDYYLTYSQSVEAEVREALAVQGDFLKGPMPLFRDSMENLNRGFVVRDQNYLSARWPGDAHRFAIEFVKMLGA
ncbi:MAG: hypothetical protein COW00_15610 [Bdellovibrio sp. CG12_big_fil_rev_8_21_14_0_65_39_13]|nr:MAG: hypothetical protein COW78_05475 [Bdellovibrio sp. CG22_combo_CG10-13_8_21_14_all_39_27]PIQ58426.1 MAG: hypothetical protein COW00_15610 [Bdellovibrio sp. CG12_big_fil_rev_8_21_14_0_65_39_13]PIR35379.1 MAG: hypothetical protein COV37_07825 [Bdellovibrio sp. CG11_big_fil_rev_8_21_14_0_20_39_38]PJB52393.1 MAG: hypothetical protein CO099_12785 [Bdellovibrio sp. CG_4_9_14_3_um_filter_39_7]